MIETNGVRLALQHSHGIIRYMKKKKTTVVSARNRLVGIMKPTCQQRERERQRYTIKLNTHIKYPKTLNT